MRSVIQKLDQKIEALEKERKKKIASIQRKCKHPDKFIREVEYVAGHYSTLYPFRVCTSCGYAEEGWGCGYRKLNRQSEYPHIGRDEGMEHALTIKNQDGTVSHL